MGEYQIKSIESITISTFTTKVIEQNTPIPQKVSMDEFKVFLKDNECDIVGESRGLLFGYEKLDKYGNVIATHLAIPYLQYWINPELLKMGKDRDCKIIDIIEETTNSSKTVVPKPSSFQNSDDTQYVSGGCGETKINSFNLDSHYYKPIYIKNEG